MKLDALQRVEELQSQLHDAQQSAVPTGSSGGKDTPALARKPPTLWGLN